MDAVHDAPEIPMTFQVARQMGEHLPFDFPLMGIADKVPILIANDSQKRSGFLITSYPPSDFIQLFSGNTFHALLAVLALTDVPG